MAQFIETLLVPEGMLAGTPFVLRPFQKDIIGAIYNPVTAESCGRDICLGQDCPDRTCTRIVRKSIYSVAKKNGKTPLIGALCLGHLIGPEAKRNEQIYAGAFDRDQASITFRYMAQMVLMDEELADNLTIRESKKEIFCRQTGSIFRALSSEVKGKHGLGPAVLIMDELAQFGSDRRFFDTLTHGRGAHLEPLLWIISTQAPNDAAILSEEIDYGLRVESGDIVDPTVRCFLFTTPIDADAYDSKNWRMSNPALGDFLNAQDLEEAARVAKAMPSAEATFRNLRLNQRVDASEHFITPDTWRSCGDKPDHDLFTRFPCHGGLDLSAKNDLTALVLVAQDKDGVWHVLPYFWTPGENLREKEMLDRTPYCYWRDHGFLQATPGRVIDYGFVAQKIGELAEDYIIPSIRFDRWRIEDLKREMDARGVACWIWGQDWSEGDRKPRPGGICLIPHGQGYKDMNPAVETMEDLLTEARLRHGNHPVLTWCASNVRVQRDPAGNRKFDKLKSTGRIDGIVALAMALDTSMDIQPKQSVYESRGVMVF